MRHIIEQKILAFLRFKVDVIDNNVGIKGSEINTCRHFINIYRVSIKILINFFYMS